VRLRVQALVLAVIGLVLPSAAAPGSSAPLIAFESSQSGDFEVWTVRLDGSGLRRLTHARTGSGALAVWRLPRGIGGSAPLADGTGWLEHGQPLMPNS